MPTSNVQLQSIQTQLNTLGIQNYQRVQQQIANLKTRIAQIDKTNTIMYSSALEQLYMLQASIASSNTTAINSLLEQKVELLKNLIVL